MAGQVLHILQGHVLGEQVGHDQDPEAVGTEDRRQAGIFKPPLEQASHVIGRQGTVGQHFPVSQGRPEQRGLFGCVLDPGRLQILPEPAVEVVADGDLLLFPPFSLNLRTRWVP